MATMKEICEYWKHRAMRESFIRYKGEEEMKEITDMCDEGAWVYTFFQELQG